MRSTLIVSAFAALALAAPRPQDIEFDLVDAAPDPIPSAAPFTGTSETVPAQAAAAAAAIGTQAVDSTTSTTKRSFAVKRNDGDCSKQPAGTGTQVSTPNDTPDSFKNFPEFHNMAQKYAVPANVPQGYTLSFSDLYGSSQQSGYKGYKTLSKYDPIACQQYCDADPDCVAFNLFYERDPTLNPNTVNCPNPASLTNIKCVKWAVWVTPEQATNTGEHRASFEVVIAGSNGYNKIAGPPTQNGWTGPVTLGGAINAPNDPTSNTNTYAGYKFFGFGSGQGQVQGYNAGVTACLAASTEQGAYNSRHTTPGVYPTISNQVVTYVLSADNVPQGIYCAIYSEAWASNYATNVGQYRGSVYYSVSQAYSFTNTTYATNYPEGPICAKGGCPDPQYRGGNCGGWLPSGQTSCPSK